MICIELIAMVDGTPTCRENKRNAVPCFTDVQFIMFNFIHSVSQLAFTSRNRGCAHVIELHIPVISPIGDSMQFKSIVTRAACLQAGMWCS